MKLKQEGEEEKGRQGHSAAMAPMAAAWSEGPHLKTEHCAARWEWNCRSWWSFGREESNGERVVAVKMIGVQRRGAAQQGEEKKELAGVGH